METASKIQLMAVGLVLATAALVGPVVFWGYDALVDRQQTEALDRLVTVEGRRFSAALLELEHDVALLQEVPALGALRARQPEIAAALSVPQLEAVLVQVFAAMVTAKPHYAQIRFIGAADAGRERVRVDRRDGVIRPVPSALLQPKGHRPYFTAVIGLEPDETYISRVELNREEGRIEQPEWATLRIARAVRDARGQPFGVLIINLDFSAFVADLYHRGSGRSVRHFIANEGGHYLVHPDPARTFGFDRGTPHRAQDDHPALAPLFTPEGPEQMQIRADGQRIAWRRIGLPSASRGEALFIGVAATDDAGAEADIVIRALALTAAAMLAALLGGVFFSRRLIRPLRRITAAARAIGEGRLAEPLPAERADEIGVLARTFEQMVAVLAEKERRLADTNAALEETNTALARANRDLQQFAHVATHDLREPARRAAGIADLLMLEEDERLSADGVAMLERLQGITENMLARIADFRVLAGIGSGRLVRSEVDLDALLDAVLDEAGAPQVPVSRDRLPTIRAYPELVALMYRTLILDAARRAAEAPFRIHFGATAAEAGLILSMTISGYGLSPDVLRGIFDRMARLGDEAHGLGLSVCRRVVEHHTGWIRVASEGAEVEFTFNLGEPSDERSHTAG